MNELNSNITSTGKDLFICLTCESLPIYNWMAFASWFSFNINLPDAKFVINLTNFNSDVQLFMWTYRCKVQFLKNYVPPNFLEIEPTVMAVREFVDCLGPKDAKSNEYSTLVNYKDGCGNFILSDWVNKLDYPFNKIKQITNNKYMSINEVKILNLWKRCNSLYNFVN